MSAIQRILSSKYTLYFFFGVLALYCVKIARSPSDFTVFLEAARYLSEGNVPYGEWLYVSEGYFCHYFYSPFWATILLPLGKTSPFIIQMVWLLLNLFFLFRLGLLLEAYIKTKVANWVWLILLVFSVRFLLYNLEMVQMTIFLLWGSLESLRLMRTKNWLWGSLLLAFVINVKIMPVVLIPYLLYRAHYKFVFLVILFLGILILLPGFILGWSFNWEVHLAWFDAINPINTEHSLETDLGPHSLTAWIPTLLTETKGIIDSKRHIVNLGTENAILVMNLVRIGLILSVLLVLKWPPFKKLDSTYLQLYEISYLFFLIPLIFPHQQKYAFFCLLPAWFYLILQWQKLKTNKERDAKSRRSFNGLTITLGFSFLLMTLTTDGLIGRELNEWAQHYKLITIGAVVLIPTFFLISPKQLSKDK